LAVENLAEVAEVVGEAPARALELGVESCLLPLGCEQELVVRRDASLQSQLRSDDPILWGERAACW
jgi:hypothetical protein